MIAKNFVLQLLCLFSDCYSHGFPNSGNFFPAYAVHIQSYKARGICMQAKLLPDSDFICNEKRSEEKRKKERKKWDGRRQSGENSENCVNNSEAKKRCQCLEYLQEGCESIKTIN